MSPPGVDGPPRQARRHDPVDIEPPTGRSPGWSRGINGQNVGCLRNRGERRRQQLPAAPRVADHRHRLRLHADQPRPLVTTLEERRHGRAGRGYQGRHRHITSSTNTFTGLTQGLDVTIAPGTAGRTPVDVTVARDIAGPGVAAEPGRRGQRDPHPDRQLTAYDADHEVRPARWPATRWCGTCATKVLDAVTRSADGTSLADLGCRPTATARSSSTPRSSRRAYAADPAKVSATKLGRRAPDARARASRPGSRRSASAPATPPTGC